MGLLRLLAGWQPIDATEYAAAYARFGGSVVTEPRLLAMLAEHAGVATRFYGRRGADGALVAAVPAWGGWIAGDKEALEATGVAARFDFGTPEILVPLAPGFRGLLPWRSKHLANIQAPQVSNALARNRGRSLCLAKGLAGDDGMSARSCQKRRNEVRRFLDAGGEVHPLEGFTADELAAIYDRLFAARWQRPHPNAADLPLLIAALRPLLRGHVLFFRGAPCAYQFLLGAASARFLAVEFVNGGVDPAVHEHSPGSVLTWLNIEQAWNEAQAAGLSLRYSFGRNSGAYKAQWANEHPLLRVVAC